MTGIFDGMTTIVAAVLGGPVTVYPGGGAATTIQAVFRAQPEVEENDYDPGSVIVTVSTLRVLAEDAATLVKGDRIEPGNGKAYELSDPIPSGSPAADAFVLFQLTEITE